MANSQSHIRCQQVFSRTHRSSAQFPEDLIERMIKGFSNENELILDPFMGSGTTAKTAMLNNRKFLGFEINDSYFNIIADRLDNTLKEIDIKSRTLELFQ